MSATPTAARRRSGPAAASRTPGRRTDSASDLPGACVAVTSEDATTPVLGGRTRLTPAVPRGDGAPSGHGRVHASAVLSADRKFRYLLRRAWAPGPVMSFVMLNPSTADESSDDPTIRRCMAFARSAGCAGVTVGNLYAWRSVDPSALRAAPDPVGPDNDEWLARIVSQPGPVVAAWGARADPRRVGDVLAVIGSRELQCLGITASGQPRHPLYVPAATPLQPLPLAGLVRSRAHRGVPQGSGR